MLFVRDPLSLACPHLEAALKQRSDVIVVGSGPSGTHAAARALELGCTVTILDYGNVGGGCTVPDGGFSALRRTDPMQRRYFIGDSISEEHDANDRLGAHFTAPRRFITRDVDRALPVKSVTFYPVQSLALGGLGAGWGAGAPTFEPFELELAGLPQLEIGAEYSNVAEKIGISGAADDDTAAQVLRMSNVQPSAEIDSNARTIMGRYSAERAILNSRGFTLGRAPLALLTKDMPDTWPPRRANPYTDMDFYGASARSVYRPEYSIAHLQKATERFTYVSGVLVETFSEREDGIVVVRARKADGTYDTWEGKKVILAAGAINSARIAARSRAQYGVRMPLLCNPMTYIACINAPMLGRAADDKRHSLAQLLGMYTPPHRAPEHVMAAVYSYRSLLHYRLVKDMPLPPTLGLLVSRALMTSLTLIGVHHPERFSEDKWLRLDRVAQGDVLTASYELSEAERADLRQDIRGLKKCLQRLRCFPVAVFDTPAGSSIHYAGTIPSKSPYSSKHLTCNELGRLSDQRHVYVGDSASWTYLPAKGLTLTLMANARRIAGNAVRDLRSSEERVT